ncbi:hypothetical protein ACFQZQ_11575 [Lysobacter koreensis]|uniref:Uncharacterized protein n=1 Tax=Lysobacter koreensis TaxID=266122 RepID=A0ABW2YNB6_9GAMM
MRGRRNAWHRGSALLFPAWKSAAMAAADPAAAQLGELAGDGPFQQFIVKYRDGSEPQLDEAAVQPRLDATAAGSSLGGVEAGRALALRWQRRLAVAADVVRAERPLDRAEAARLMQQFAVDPAVEYVEVDGIVSHQQGGIGLQPMGSAD